MAVRNGKGNKTIEKNVSKVTKSKGKGQVCTYDFTLFDEISIIGIRNTLKEVAKKYAFQQEKGEETGRLHFQGRISLKVKKRQPELIKILSNHGWVKFHISITSNENRDNSFYVMKADTRVDGPFTDENEIYVPKDISKITALRPWQSTLIERLNTYDERVIDIVFDEKGNIGKSTLTRYMMLFSGAELLPFCNDYKDIMRMAFDIGPKPIYLIDMPRAISKEKLFQFFSAIETLKSGYCYDDRYNFKRRIFDRPRICIFTNTYPDTTLLSNDMWKIWSINENELVPYMLTNQELDQELDLLPNQEPNQETNEDHYEELPDINIVTYNVLDSF